jgi:hypothetical protein
MILLESEKYELSYLVKNKKLTYNHDITKKLTKLWEETTIEERLFLVEFLSTIYPKKVKLINESRWYNTLADIIGIFDPTGVVDILNGVSYWRQGDKLFAILSWIGAIPGLGDLIAKPIIGVMKIGSTSTKAFKAAVEAGNAAKIAETASKAGGSVSSFVKGVYTWGDNLVSVLQKTVGRVPIGLPFLAGGATLSGKGFVRTVEEWVNLFKSASSQMKSSDEVYKAILQGSKPLTNAEKQLMLKQLEKQNVTAFRTYKGTGQNFKEKYISGGLGTLWGNRATRSLMVRTKSYLGFLDYLGIGNFDTDPEDLIKNIPNVEQKLEEYGKTPQGKKNFEDDFGGGGDAPPPGLTADEYAAITNKTQKTNLSGGGGISFDMAGALGKSSNPIISLFSSVLK